MTDVLLTIGQFSKMTYLTVKALRHYQEVGLLEPAAIDPSTGYRQYSSTQVPTAQAIRRFRDLKMPIDEVRRVLQAPDMAARDRAILVHLERMHEQLEQTQASVAALQALLTGDLRVHAEVEVRRLPATRALVRRQEVAFADCGPWLTDALADLHATATAAGVVATGPDGALYTDEFFEAGVGNVTAFVPVRDDASDFIEFAAQTVAVLVHDGPFTDLDRAYGTLGTVVAERGIAGPGPIREHYLSATSTEVCWPITTAGATA